MATHLWISFIRSPHVLCLTCSDLFSFLSLCLPCLLCLVFLLFPSSLKLCPVVTSSSFLCPFIHPFCLLCVLTFCPICHYISSSHLLCLSSLARLPRSRPVSGAAPCARLRGLTPGQVGVCRARGEVMESVRKAAEMVIEEVWSFSNAVSINVCWTCMHFTLEPAGVEERTYIHWNYCN